MNEKVDEEGILVSGGTLVVVMAYGVSEREN